MNTSNLDFVSLFFFGSDLVAGQHVQQRAFADAVFADQAVPVTLPSKEGGMTTFKENKHAMTTEQHRGSHQQHRRSNKAPKNEQALTHTDTHTQSTDLHELDC